MDNLFVTSKNTRSNPFSGGRGKKVPYRANNVMKVGGRRVTASYSKNTEYDFSIIVTYKEPNPNLVIPPRRRSKRANGTNPRTLGTNPRAKQT